LPQFNWTYPGDDKKLYHVGLFHGKQTGHVLVHCNARIMLIDFGVLDSKTYTFFINDELFELKLDRRGDRFFYTLEIDNKADTPKNRARKKVERRYWLQTLLVILGLAAVVTVAIFLFGRNKSKASDWLAGERALAYSKVRFEPDSFESTIQYHFIVESWPYQGEKIINGQNGWLLDENVMPLLPGDEFKVEYSPDRPKLNRILLDQPSPEQVERYKARALQRHLELNPGDNRMQVKCMIDIAYQQKGIVGIADFYFQDISTEINPTNNQNSYSRLIKDVPFRKKVLDECW
jgi:hypothetical protein